MRIVHTFLHGITREEYSEDGVFHREDGPALICEYLQLEVWYFKGHLHREDGPAIDSPDYKAWFVQGEKKRVEFSSGRVYERP